MLVYQRVSYIVPLFFGDLHKSEATDDEIFTSVQDELDAAVAGEAHSHSQTFHTSRRPWKLVDHPETGASGGPLQLCEVQLYIQSHCSILQI